MHPLVSSVSSSQGNYCEGKREGTRERRRIRKIPTTTIHEPWVCVQLQMPTGQWSSCSHAHPSLHQSASHAGAGCSCLQLFTMADASTRSKLSIFLPISYTPKKLKLQTEERRRKKQNKSKRRIFSRSASLLAYPVQICMYVPPAS